MTYIFSGASQLSAVDLISVPTAWIRRYFFTLKRATTGVVPATWCATSCATSCAMAGATKRKSNEYPDDEGFVANDSDGSDRPRKRSKNATSSTKSRHVASTGEPQVDDNGDPYWELSKMRRVTVSEFKGKRMVNIREYYEQNGKTLPGKKVDIILLIQTFGGVQSQWLTVTREYCCQWTNIRHSLRYCRG